MLLELGQRLDSSGTKMNGQTVRDFLAVSLLKVRNKSGQLLPLQPNAAQREFARRYGRRNIVLKARQLGITTYVAARFFLQTITRPGTLTVQVAHDQRAAEEIFRIVHRFLENLPASVRSGALRTSHANVRQIVFPRLDSEYRVETAADPNAGRGLTIQNLHCSEVARWPGDAAETLASLRAAVTPDGEVVLESTANGAGGVFYNEWQGAERAGYVRHFFPWWMEESYRLPGADVEELTAEERAMMQCFGLDDEQIAYRREVRMHFGERMAQEYAEDAESCFLASGNCVFDAAMLEQRMRALPEPMERRENGALEIYWPARRGTEQQQTHGVRCAALDLTADGVDVADSHDGREGSSAGKQYIIGVDAAGGGSNGDYACAQVIERETGLQCAELYGHYGPEELARKAAALGREYNNALVVVELNNHGHAVVAQLRTVERYENLYRCGNNHGWTTTVVTRPRMLETLAAVVQSKPELFASRRLLEECKTFVRHTDGRAAAASGTHDDAVMAMAVALGARGK